TIHHIVMDGGCMVLVLDEVFRFHDALRSGATLPQLAEPGCYGDYIQWLQRQDLEASERFWRDLLSGFAEPAPLPSLRVAPSNGTRQGYADVERRLSEECTIALRILAKDSGVALSTILYGAWALQLARYSGSDDVVFGATRNCRRSAMDGNGVAEPMVG